MNIEEFNKGYIAGALDAEAKIKGRIYGIYAELCKEFEHQPEVMKVIDKHFGKVEG